MPMPSPLLVGRFPLNRPSFQSFQSPPPPPMPRPAFQPFQPFQSPLMEQIRRLSQQPLAVPPFQPFGPAGALFDDLSIQTSVIQVRSSIE